MSDETIRWGHEAPLAVGDEAVRIAMELIDMRDGADYREGLRLLWRALGVVDAAFIGIDQSVNGDPAFTKRALLTLVDIHRFFGMNEEGEPRSDQTPEQLARCEAAGFEVVRAPRPTPVAAPVDAAS